MCELFTMTHRHSADSTGSRTNAW